MPTIKQINYPYEPFTNHPIRSVGPHLTSIIRSLQSTLGMGKTAANWDMAVCADIGFLWEDAFSIAYGDRLGIIRPPELITPEGIIMSPDGIGEDPEGIEDVVNHEYKCTWRSTKKSPLDDFYWMTQFACYCRGLFVTTTILHVMYTNGDYRGSGPGNFLFRIGFSQAELDRVWQMVVNHGKEKGVI